MSQNPLDAKQQHRARSRRYYAEHRHSINLSRRKHPEVEGKGNFNKENPSHFDFGASNRKPTGEASFARLVRQYKANARRRNISFDLTKEEIRAITQSNCAYCGVHPRQKMQDKDANGPYIYNGIDRADPAVGYVKHNCVSACKTCNRVKSDMNQLDWTEWLRRLVVFQTLEKDESPKSLARSSDSP